MGTKLVFMGTPRFAVPSLRALREAGYEISGVITQPDRRKGRGKKVVPPPIKETALALGIPVYQPDNPNTEDFLHQLAALSPNIIVTVAFGHLLKKQILNLPPLGCLNVHASLLPKYRGAAPIAWAIFNGEEVTGVTIMKMDEGMDTGPILAVRKEAIRPDDTTETLSQRLSEIGAELIVETLREWLAGRITPLPQDPSQATYAPPLTKGDGKIDWTRSALEIERQIRAMIPWPGAFTTIEGKILKIFKAKVVDMADDLKPGQSIITDDAWRVVTGNGTLELSEIQLEGKKRQEIHTFLKGFKSRGMLTLS